MIADSERAYLLISCAGGTPDAPPVEIHDIPDGLSMITAGDLNDATSPRVRRYLPRFREAPIPSPEIDDWDAWQSLLAGRDHEPESGPEGAMTIVTDRGFGTVCSSLLAVPPKQEPIRRTLWLFASGRPDRTPFKPVEI